MVGRHWGQHEASFTYNEDKGVLPNRQFSANRERLGGKSGSSGHPYEGQRSFKKLQGQRCKRRGRGGLVSLRQCVNSASQERMSVAHLHPPHAGTMSIEKSYGRSPPSALRSVSGRKGVTRGVRGKKVLARETRSGVGMSELEWDSRIDVHDPARETDSDCFSFSLGLCRPVLWPAGKSMRMCAKRKGKQKKSRHESE